MNAVDEARARRSPRRRYAANTRRMTGAADGSIMPAIITAHMTNSASQSAAPQACMSAMPIAACILASMAIDCMLAASLMRYSQAITVIAAMPITVVKRSRRMIRSSGALDMDASFEGLRPSFVALDSFLCGRRGPELDGLSHHHVFLLHRID